MTKRDWFLVILSLPLVWGADQLTKLWANRFIFGLHFYGPLGLVMHKNPGAMFGAFADLPPLLRVVSLSTGGAFLIFIYGVIQHLLPARLLRLRIGMSVLLGGILGNVTDRVVDGSVTDFIVFGTRSFSTPAFNLADAVQWIGYGLIVITLSQNGNVFWPDINARKRTWINPNFQLKYCAILIANGLAFAAISGVFAYTFLKITIMDLVVGPSFLTQRRFLLPFLEIYAVISMAFVAALFLLGKTLSHRTAGPIFAFEKYVDDILAGRRPKPLKLRNADEFKELEDLAARLKAHLHVEEDLQLVDEESATGTEG